MDSIDEKVEQHTKDISSLQKHVDTHAKLIKDLQRNDERIMAVLATAATKEDVLAVGNKIDNAVNGILRDALNAVPARQANIWLAIGAIAAVCALIVEILSVHH